MMMVLPRRCGVAAALWCCRGAVVLSGALRCCPEVCRIYPPAVCLPSVADMETTLDPRPGITANTSRPAPVPPQALGLALATMEGLLGRRGLHQLRPWLSHAAFLQLVSHVEAGTFDRSTLGRLRLQMPTSLAVEASARISLGHRWLACTVRLDRADRWLCSDVTVVGVPVK